MRRHLTYANVMSTVGVFLALGGGYAAAKLTAGGDRVTDGQAFNLGENFKTVANAPGVGKVKANCDPATEDTLIAWRTTDHRIYLFREQEGNSSGFQSNRGEQHTFLLDNTQPRIEFHAIGDLDNDNPQATVTAAAGNFSGGCAQQVAAQVVVSD